MSPLTIGEIWAIAITLRIVLIENLRRLADEIRASRALRDAADHVADNLLGIGDGDANDAMNALRERESAPLDRAFAVHLIERLRDQDPATTPALPWLHQRLTAEGTSPEATVQAELQWQAATTVTARNVITSMRLVSAIGWSDFFERVSLVDELLRAQTNFAAMDFQSRDNYRHAIERLARRSRQDELMVTQEVIRRTAADGESVSEARRNDPGFHLIGAGRRAFEKSIGYRPAFKERLLRTYVRAATPGYLGPIVILTVAILLLPLWLAGNAGAPLLLRVILAVLAAIPASEIAITLLNRAVTALISPRVLPRLELREGIPASLRTLVALPTLLTDEPAVLELVERLEAHYLANPDGDVYFALLMDWIDADAQTVPGDEEILDVARRGIAQLNARYGNAPGGGDRFLVLHRERRWSDTEQCWMGWERKRGKLRELNKLLRGATDTSFRSVAGAVPAVPGGVRYVIALDADTRMTIGAVSRLVGTMAHPLNRASFDPTAGRVTEGYGLLQPRITPPLPMGNSSFFQRVTSGPGGVDPYAAAVSDVYQDLFEEGSFTGKGIYDVDVLEQALDDRVPENAVLSHDLFEGIFVRTALVTDIELFEVAPSHYLVAAARQHRWARGDWQLLPLLFRFQMPLIARWKMIDNLRRSLFAPTAVLTLSLAWIAPTSAPTAWTLLVLIAIALPAFLPALAGIWPRRQGASKRSHARAVTRDFLQGASQTGLAATMLAHQAWVMSDAIVRTLTRLFVTHRHLLEWLTAAQVESGSRLTLQRFLRTMVGAVVLGVVVAELVLHHHPAAIPLALPFAALWCASPWLAHRASIPAPAIPAEPLSSQDADVLRLIARKTWRFFDTFVTAEDRLPSAGQLPGNTDAGRGASHLADEHRPVPALDGRRKRLRLDWHAGIGRASRADARCNGHARAIARALLQLVRYPRQATARSSLPVVGRQRQSCRRAAGACRQLSRPA